jgi:hypothetical protein
MEKSGQIEFGMSKKEDPQLWYIDNRTDSTKAVTVSVRDSFTSDSE